LGNPWATAIIINEEQYIKIVEADT